jgi:hypothetical protein
MLRSANGMDVVLLCFSVDNASSLKNLEQHRSVVAETGSLALVNLMVGCKSDLPWEVNVEDIREVSFRFRCRHLTCSAKNNEFVDDVVALAVEQFVEQQKDQQTLKKIKTKKTKKKESRSSRADLSLRKLSSNKKIQKSDSVSTSKKDLLRKEESKKEKKKK